MSLHFQANAAQDGDGNQAYTGKITFTKTILWLIPVTATITNRTFNIPANVLPYETFAGDFYNIPVTAQSISGADSLAKYSITLNTARSFGFVPTPSALDIGKDSVTLVESDYLLPYTEAFPPQKPKNTPFANFITAFDPITAGAPNNNEAHISYETRNGNWLAKELNGITSQIADCSALCQTYTISGDAYDCNNLKTYSVPSYSNVTYHWTVSPNLQMKSANGQAAMQVLPYTGHTGEQGTLTVSMTITNNPDCGTQTISKTIGIGIEPLVVNSSVDRTPQQNGYQYLTATATQLGSTVPANYSWYLLVNNQPTTLIGTGLTLSHYPIPPCTTIYYQCQATTACGLSTYSSYAYNTNCGGNYAMSNQSVMIYPNPADNSMTVTNNNIPLTMDASGNATGIVPQSYQLVVLNSLGNTLISAQNINGNPNITFDTSGIPNGKYFIHVIQGSNVIEKQIIIQH